MHVDTTDFAEDLLSLSFVPAAKGQLILPYILLLISVLKFSRFYFLYIYFTVKLFSMRRGMV
jgi:hypothetical protein